MANPLEIVAPRAEALTDELYQISKDALAEIQRGNITQPTFYGNQALTSAFSSFMSGMMTSRNYAGRPSPTLNQTQNLKLEQVAQSMANFSMVPFDQARTFLEILINVDNESDFTTITEAVGLDDVMPTSMMGNASLILNVPGIEAVGFLANAVSALISQFAKYVRAADTATSANSFDPLDMISSMLGMFGLGSSALGSSLLDKGTIETKLGNFLSELVLGQRIPVPVIAQNPMKEPPTYVGKVFFGELQGLMPLVDINEIFPKKLGVFPSPSNGAGRSSFNFMNMSSFMGAMPLGDAINTMNFGTTSLPAGSFLSDLSTSQISTVQSMLGAGSDEKIELNRADNAIPFMMAMSAVNTGRDKSPFPSEAFTQGWALASHVTQYMQTSGQSDFLDTLRGRA